MAAATVVHSPCVKLRRRESDMQVRSIAEPTTVARGGDDAGVADLGRGCAREKRTNVVAHGGADAGAADLGHADLGRARGTMPVTWQARVTARSGDGSGLDGVVSHNRRGCEEEKTITEHWGELNPEKCSFGVQAGRFLGFMLTERGIEANSDKCRAVINMRSP
ncbi:hypothetical protein CR513_04227, partial [Mucuna pruriens]